MVNSENAKTVYNSRAQKYERAMHTFHYASSLQQAILSLPLQLPEKAKILELGCGTGITTEALLKKFPHAPLVGMDYSEEMLALCKQKFPQLTLLQGDFNRREKFMSACREAGLSPVEEVKISWKYFPTSFVKYGVVARK